MVNLFISDMRLLVKLKICIYVCEILDWQIVTKATVIQENPWKGQNI